MHSWQEKDSVRLSRFAVRLFTILLAAADVGGWWLVRFVSSIVTQNHGMPGRVVLLVCLYACSVPGYVLLCSLYRLLQNLEKDSIFTAENVCLLRRVSWCCTAAAVICLCGMPVWPSLFLVAVAAAFMALIVHVVKNVFVRAIGMKDELDYTV